MKKTLLLYMLTIIITFVCFSVNVNAAEELTCVYKKGKYDDKIMLIQKNTGTRYIYAHSDKNATAESSGWTIRRGWEATIDDVSNKDEFGNLTECPEAVINEDGISNQAMYKKFQDVVDNGDYNGIEYMELEKETPGTDIFFENNEDGVGTKVNWLDKLESPYTGSCIYERLVEMKENNITIIEKHHIQVNYGEKAIHIAEFDPAKGNEFSGVKSIELAINASTWKYGFSVSSVFDDISYYLNFNNGNCSRYMVVDRLAEEYIVESKVLDFNSKDGAAYYLISVEGVNPLTGKEMTLEGITDPKVNSKDKIENCSELLGEDIAGWLNMIWQFIKIGIPIILIGLGILDFSQAIFSGKEDGMKKAQGKFIKRLIIAIVIFLIPSILELLLNIANSIWGNFGSDLCGILF